MSAFLGIDLGSSTCRTVLQRDGALEVVNNRFYEHGLPPVMPVIQPPVAEAKFAENEFPVVFRSLKQELGSLQLVETVAGTHQVEEKIADVLGQIREDVLGTLSEPLAGTVLSIPGFYTDSARAALRDAAHSAGFSAVRLIDEGMAVILGTNQPLDRGTVLVFALGSGVFSATVLVIESGRPRVVSTEGDRFLGGSTLDTALASLLLRRLDVSVDFPDPKSSAIYLKKLAEHVKLGLSRREEELFDVNLTELLGKVGIVPLVVKRSEFEEAISEPVDLIFDLTRRALAGAGTSPSGLDLIVMVGDSTRIPIIDSRLSAEYSTNRIRAGLTDVAKGAAMFGSQIGDGNWKRRESVAPAEPPPAPAVSPLPVQRVREQRKWVDGFAPRFLQAEEQWNAGDHRGAIQTFEGLHFEVGVYLGTLYHTQGQGLFRDGKFDEAVELLGKAVRFTPEGDDLDRVNKDYHRSLNHRALQLEQSGRLEEAWFTIRKALDLNSECEGCGKLAQRIRQALKISGPGRAKRKKR